QPGVAMTVNTDAAFHHLLTHVADIVGLPEAERRGKEYLPLTLDHGLALARGVIAIEMDFLVSEAPGQNERVASRRRAASDMDSAGFLGVGITGVALDLGVKYLGVLVAVE